MAPFVDLRIVKRPFSLTSPISDLQAAIQHTVHSTKQANKLPKYMPNAGVSLRMVAPSPW
jgi:hypothetical protein